MNIREYLKQRWYLFLILSIASLFSLLVMWSSAAESKSDFIYIFQGAFIALAIFIVIDFIKLKTRIKNMQDFIENDCIRELKSNYPLDAKYALMIKEKLDDFNAYKENTESEHSSELEFITKWVHDVKVPVSAIKLLIENTDNNESQKMEMQLNYIEQNIEKILYNMKSKNFYDDYKISKVNIRQIVNKALKNYAVFFSYKSISLDINIDDFEVLTDIKWSIYIVSQLISNAVKYTNEGGKIEISTLETESKIALSIKNSGEGIDKINIKNIFKRGYSSYSTRKEKSTGYGLYLSKKLIDKMGHDIEAKSKQNEYTQFIVSYDKLDEYK